MPRPIPPNGDIAGSAASIRSFRPSSNPLACGPLGYQGSKAAMKIIAGTATGIRSKESIANCAWDVTWGSSALAAALTASVAAVG